MRPKQAVNMAAVPKQTNTVPKRKKVVPNSTKLLGRKKVPKLVATVQLIKLSGNLRSSIYYAHDRCRGNRKFGRLCRSWCRLCHEVHEVRLHLCPSCYDIFLSYSTALGFNQAVQHQHGISQSATACSQYGQVNGTFRPLLNKTTANR